MNHLNHDHCIQTIQPILLPPPHSIINSSTSTLITTPHPLHHQLMQSLKQQLAITQTLINQLSRMLPLECKHTTSEQQKKSFQTPHWTTPTQPCPYWSAHLSTSAWWNPCMHNLHATSTSTSQNPRITLKQSSYFTFLQFSSGQCYNSPLCTPKISWKSHSRPKPHQALPQAPYSTDSQQNITTLWPGLLYLA